MGPRHEFVPWSAAASAVSDVLAHAADPTGLVGTVRKTIRKTTTTNQLLKETEDTCTEAANEFISAATSDS